jgi:hypothetical protein
MGLVTIRKEAAGESGWRYEVAVADAGRTHAFDVTLARADYERWAASAVPPAEVVRAAFAFLLDREPVTSILTAFDCAVIRRYFPEVDRELPRLLAAGSRRA